MRHFPLLAVALMLSRDVTAQVQENWLRVYNTSTNTYESAVALALSPGGDVYVGGNANLDYALLKYSPEGIPIWTNTFNGPAGGKDLLKAIRLGPDGSVHVTGTSYGVTNREDIVTLKYSAEGSLLWSAEYTNGVDIASGLAVDGSGNVYVCGATAVYGRIEKDPVLIKYSATGQELWRSVFRGTNGSGFVLDESAVAVGTDNQGSIYLLATSYSDSYTSSYLLIKHNPAGERLWAKYYGDGGGLNDPVSLAFDAAGGVIISGTSSGRVYQSGEDYLTLKLDKDGVILWSARYDDFVKQGQSDRVAAAAVGPGGTTYVTGRSGNAREDIVTVAYNPDGTRKWLSRYETSPIGSSYYSLAPSGIAIDSAGKAYVIGGIGSTQTLVVAYDSAGTMLWSVRTPSVVSTNAPLAVDTDGRVYAGGETPGTVSLRDMALVQFGQNIPPGFPGITRAPVDLIVPQGSNAVFEVEATGEPPLYLTWRFNNRTNVPSNEAELTLTNVSKVNRGYYSCIVSNRYGSVESASARLMVNVITNQPENVAMVSGGDAFFKVQVDGVGAFSYQWQFNGVNISGATSNLLALLGVEATNAGYFRVVVSNEAGVIVSDSAMLSVLSSARQSWADSLDAGYSIAVGEDNSVYVVGSTPETKDPPHLQDVVTARFSSDGTRLWRSLYNGPANVADGRTTTWSRRRRLVAVDPAGNAYVGACSGTGPVNVTDVVTIKYGPNGGELWARRYSSGGNAYPVALALDPLGNICTAGTADGFLAAKYDPAGNLLWSRSYPNDTFATDMALDGAGNVYLTGRGGHVIKLDSLGNLAWEAATASSLWGVALDSQTNVIASGNVDRDMNFYDGSIAKFTAQGSLAWEKFHPETGSAYGWQSAFDAAAGPQDVIYVAANDGTIKYKPTGEREWLAPYGGQDIKLTANAIYVLNSIQTLASGADYLLQKLDLGGALLWAARYGTAADEYPEAIAVDAEGGVYVTGSRGTVKFAEQPVPSTRVEAWLENTRFVLSVHGEPGRFYQVQASANLSEWTTITNMACTLGTLEFIDPAQNQHGARYYRAVKSF